ncbi:MAG: hypothetical protein IPK66_09850 [Rhodospirillales bacterium]|nr:hypothetical protein [Rhodospirillales bacterium]
MSFTTRAKLPARLIVGAALVLIALRPVTAETLPNEVRASIASIVGEASSRPDQCPAPSALSSLAQERPDLTVAIAEETAKRIRSGSSDEDDSLCPCVGATAKALAAANADDAADIRDVFANVFPNCDENITAGIEESLLTDASGPGGPPRTGWPTIPGFGPYGDPTKKCDACALAQPPAKDAASQTSF